MATASKEKKSETKPLAERLLEAAELPNEIWDRTRQLAEQLDGGPILPLIGAGASSDCGAEGARPIAERMYRWYTDHNKTRRQPSDLESKKGNLGIVADAVYAGGDQSKVVAALGLASEADWPSADSLPEHFCSYRVLARLAREGLLAEAITLNYDSGFERALADEGFQFAPWPFRGKAWLDHATVVTDGPDHVQLERRGELVLTKAHGCAAGYRRRLEEVEKSTMSDDLQRRARRQAEEAIVVRRGQLLDWRTDFWARDLFADRARRHVILLLGVSGEDPVIHLALTRVLEEVNEHIAGGGSGVCAEPRIVAIDRNPRTVALSSLIDQGCGRRATEAVTHLEVPEDGSMTSILIALGTEMLALRLLAEEGFVVPASRQARTAALFVAAPASLRWAYLLERRTRGADYAQRIGLERARNKGYVPLCADLHRTAQSLRIRALLRGRFGMDHEDGVEEALAGRGFLIPRSDGRAFISPGFTAGELRALCAHDLRRAYGLLDKPEDLDLVLVAEEDGNLLGRSVQRGREVEIPWG